MVKLKHASRRIIGKLLAILLNRQRLQDLLITGIESGAARPLTYCTFEKHEVIDAFRYMAAGKHIGKVSSFYYQYFYQFASF